MKDTRKKIHIFFCLLLITLAVFSQAFGNSVDGIVMNEDTEEPLEGVRVYLRPESGGGRSYQALSDNSGNYRFNFVAAGTYILSASKAGYLSYVEGDPINITAGSPISGKELLLKPGSGGGMTYVTGITMDGDTRAVLDGVTVYLRPDGGVGKTYQAVSNTAGNYQIDNVVEGIYILSASKTGYQAYTEAKPLDVIAGFPVTGQDILLLPDVGGGRISYVTGATIDGNSQIALSGVKVYLRPDGSIGRSYQAVSNSAGIYRIDNVAEGAYILSANRAGYETYIKAKPLNVIADTPILGQDILLRPGGVTGINEGGVGHFPGEAALYQNTPNPFNPTTQIRFYLPNAQQVRLSVYNILGQVVKEIVNGYLPAGKHVMAWDGTDLNGQKAGSGIYLCILEHNHQRLVRKMLLTH